MARALKMGMLLSILLTLCFAASSSAAISVNAGGDDATADGTQAAPYRTITAALANLGTETEVQVGAGAYDPTAGEVFPLSVPEGVSIVGTIGASQDASDSTVIDPDGTAEALALTASTTTAGSLQNLVITNFLGGAINATGWSGTVDHCVVTGALAGETPGIFIYSTAGDGIDVKITNTVVKDVTNTVAERVMYFYGTGTILIDNCTFDNLSVANTSSATFEFRQSDSYQAAFDLTFSDTTFENISITGGGAVLQSRGSAPFVVDRCTLQDISSDEHIIGPFGASNVRVSNSLFVNCTSGGTRGTVSGFRSKPVVINCTFVNCSSAVSTDNGDRLVKMYNSIVSNCTALNSHSGTKLELYNVDAYNTPIGGYDTDLSTNVIDVDPIFEDPANGDYRLKNISTLVDAGDNAILAWGTPEQPITDHSGTERILDGNNDTVATADLGAFEFNSVPSEPTFVTDYPSYNIFTGELRVIPVRVEPSAGQQVDAAITYGTDLSGSPTMSFPTGAGPVDLILMTAGTVSQPGTASLVSFDETNTSTGAKTGQFAVYLYERKVTIGREPRIFVPAGEQVEISVSLMADTLTSPGATPINTSALAGEGTNSIVWSGTPSIPDGGWQSEGVLSITAGTGVNTIDLDVLNGFKFIESDSPTLSIEVIGFASPLYVAANGSDATGTGTEASPLRTVSYAASLLDEGEIIVGPGLYDTAAGETFPITLAPGVSVIGTMGTAKDDTDSTVIDADGTAGAFVLTGSTTETGAVKNLVITEFLGGAIDCTGWSGTIDNCLVTNAVAGGDGALFTTSTSGDGIDLKITNTTVKNCTNTSLKMIMYHYGTGKIVVDGCTFSNLEVGNADRGTGTYLFRQSNSYGSAFDLTFSDCIFELMDIGGGDALVSPKGSAPFVVDRCTFRNINSSVQIIGPMGAGNVRVSNSLFLNCITGGTSGTVSGFRSWPEIYNCTFYGCKNVTSTDNGGKWVRMYNCVVSDCTILNPASSTDLELHNIDVFNTTIGSYDATVSTNILNVDPSFKDPGHDDYRLMNVSPLVDAGNNDYLTWVTPEEPNLDRRGVERILDGNNDSAATVDLGAFEFNPNATDPTFVTDKPVYNMFTSELRLIPVSINPPAGQPVEAEVVYGPDLTGQGLLSFPNGTGPAEIALIAAESPQTEPGVPSNVQIYDNTGAGVEFGTFAVYFFDRKVTIERSPRVFIPAGEQAAISVNLMSSELTAPGDINITVSEPTGNGTNVLNWVADKAIKDGNWSSAGFLSVTAGTGINTIDLTLTNDFTFIENDSSTLTIEVISYSPPMYVSADGSDETGDGTQANPLRTVSYAASILQQPGNIFVGPGTYDTAAGEVFPINVAPGVSIVGTMGTAKDSTDSTVLDADGTDMAFVLNGYGGIGNLVITEFKGGAIDCTGWSGTIANCLVTNAVAGEADAMFTVSREGDGIELTISNTVVEDCSNPQADRVMYHHGTGTIIIDGCTFKNLAVANTSRATFQYEQDDSYQAAFDLTISDTVFDTINITGGGAMMQPRGSAPVLFDRCTVTNITSDDHIIGPFGASNVRVSNTLFVDCTAGDSEGVVSGFRSSPDVFNCTFVNCSSAVSTNNDNRAIRLYNSIIADCTTVNNGTGTKLELHHVDAYNTPLGIYDDTLSNDIMNVDPMFKDPTRGDYRLLNVSTLVDAGSNDYLAGLPVLDRRGVDRVLDGDNDSVATVDLGAYEYNPNAIDPTFVTETPSFNMFTSETLIVPVSIAPDAGGSVTAEIEYGADISGPASLSFPAGTGPADLAVTAAGALTVEPGTASSVSIYDSSSTGVESGLFMIYLFNREVTIGRSPRVFVPAGQQVEIPVSLMADTLAAPGAITITVGAPAGDGTNTLEWTGEQQIADRAWQSGGVLTITGGSGVNTITLTVDNDFGFVESGAGTLTVEAIGYTAPLYVAADGSDATGTGTQANPLRTISYATSILQQPGDIIVGSGTFDTAAGEEFPITVAPGVSVLGTMGGSQDATDSTVVDADATAGAFILSASGAETGALKNLVITEFKGGAIDCTGWSGTIDNCLVTNAVAGETDGMFTSSTSGDGINLTITNTTVRDCTNTATENIMHHYGTGTILIDGCTFSNLEVDNASRGGGAFRFHQSNSYGAAFDLTISNTTFESMDIGGGDGLICPKGSAPFVFDRCTMKDITSSTHIIGPMGASNVRVSNSLFVNCNASGSDGTVSGFRTKPVIINCTFDSCANATSTDNGGKLVVMYNSIVSNCTTLNSGGSTSLELHNVDAFNTPIGVYDDVNSTNILTDDPVYADAAAGDFTLQNSSPLIDAGTNEPITWESPLDRAGAQRIIDGNGDELAVTDIGCFEAEQQLVVTLEGDANGDCKVNIIDLIFIRNRLNQDVNSDDNAQADVNSDGKINIIDLIYVRNRLNTRCE